MEEKKANIKIVADATQAAESVKGLKQQLKEATKEAQNLIAQGKQNTAEYVNARNRVAELQDQMRDFNDELKALDPGAKLQTIAGVATGIAGGFQAAQGAMALFGKESEDVQKALLKVQAASAIAQGLDQVRELGKFWNLAKLAISGGVQQLGKLKVALIATGIGAFTVAVGLLVANWEKVKKAIDDTFPSLGGIGNLFDKFKKVAMGTLSSIVEGFRVFGDVVGNIFSGEFSKAVDTAKTFGSRVSKAYTEGYKEEEKAQAKEREATLLAAQVEAHQRQLKLLEAQGKDTYALKKKLIDEELKLLEYQKGKESKEYKDKYVELQLLEIEHQKKVAEIRKAAEDKATAAYFENLRLQTERTAALNQIQLDREKLNKDSEERINNTLNEFAHQRNAIDLEGLKNAQDLRQQRKQQVIEDEYAQAQAVLGIAQVLNNAMLGLGQTFIEDQKKLEEFQKKAALIQIGIDTAQAIASAVKYAAANPMNSITAGLAGAAQLAATLGVVFMNMAKARQILSSAGSSAPPTLSSPAQSNFSMPATNAPQIGNNGATPEGMRVANQSGAGANEQGQFKVYVLESDITNTQQRVKTIENKAKLF